MDGREREPSNRQGGNVRDIEPEVEAQISAKVGMGAMPNDHKLRVFLSHKEADKDLALRLKKEIECYAAGRLKVYVSGFEEAGRDWLKHIKKKLLAADWLILLYTESGHDWGWCLFESGFFEGSQFEGMKQPADEKRLYVLHAHDTDRPAPLQRFQSIPIQPPSKRSEDRPPASKSRYIQIESFVKELYGGHFRANEEPLNALLASDEERVAEVSEKLSELLGTKPVSVKRYVNRFTLRISVDQWSAAGGDIPDDSEVVGGLAFLDIEPLPKSLTWRKLMQHVTDRFGPSDRAAWAEGWRECMKNLVARVLADDVGRIDFVLPKLRDADNPKRNFRIALDQSRIFGNGDVEFAFVVLRLPSITLRVDSDDLSLVGNLVYMGRVLRWTALEPVRDELATLKLGDDGKGSVAVAKSMSDAYRSLWSMIELHIKTEVRSGGYQRRKSLDALGDRVQQDKMRKIYSAWDQALKVDLKKAMCKDADLDRSITLIGELQALTKDWMVLCSERFVQLSTCLP